MKDCPDCAAHARYRDMVSREVKLIDRLTAENERLRNPPADACYHCPEPGEWRHFPGFSLRLCERHAEERRSP